MIDSGDRVLPWQMLLRNEWPKITLDRTHIAVRQLEPRASKCIRELIRMLVEAPRDLFVCGVEPQREIRGQHGWRTVLRGIERIRDRTSARAIFRSPLVRTSRALGQFPIVLEQAIE